MLCVSLILIFFVYPTVNVILMGDDVRVLLKDFGEEGEDEDGNKSEI